MTGMDLYIVNSDFNDNHTTCHLDLDDCKRWKYTYDRINLFSIKTIILPKCRKKLQISAKKRINYYFCLARNFMQKQCHANRKR